MSEQPRVVRPRVSRPLIAICIALALFDLGMWITGQVPDAESPTLIGPAIAGAREDMNPDSLPFTDEMTAILSEARSRSRELRHDYLGTEHILLAMTDSGNVERTRLIALGIDPDQVRKTLVEVVRPGQTTIAVDVVLPYTSRTKTAFGYAVEIARGSGATKLGPEHLLAGMMREGRGIGPQVLHHHGLTLEKAEAAIQDEPGGLR
jgi:hypothetical protein